MNYKIIVILTLSLLSNKIISQTKGIINPKGKWFFGIEIGENKVTSLYNEKSKSSFQGGILSEYYFARHWSLSARIKYYETGVSFYKPSTFTSGGWFDIGLGHGSSEIFGNFNGAVISIPLGIKWEFRICKNLGGGFKLGYVYNYETKSEYSNYSANAYTDFPRQYYSINGGYGLNYFIKKNMAIYVDFEFYSGAPKDNISGIYTTENDLVNIGLKYSFKKIK
jgi:hypothetical protein